MARLSRDMLECDFLDLMTEVRRQGNAKERILGLNALRARKGTCELGYGSCDINLMRKERRKEASYPSELTRQRLASAQQVAKIGPRGIKEWVSRGSIPGGAWRKETSAIIRPPRKKIRREPSGL